MKKIIGLMATLAILCSCSGDNTSSRKVINVHGNVKTVEEDSFLIGKIDDKLIFAETIYFDKEGNSTELRHKTYIDGPDYITKLKNTKNGVMFESYNNDGDVISQEIIEYDSTKTKTTYNIVVDGNLTTYATVFQINKEDGKKNLLVYNKDSFLTYEQELQQGEDVYKIKSSIDTLDILTSINNEKGYTAVINETELKLDTDSQLYYKINKTKWDLKLNADNLVIEKTETSKHTPESNAKHVYEYNSFDKEGNWLIAEKTIINQKTGNTVKYVIKRKITYYK